MKKAIGIIIVFAMLCTSFSFVAQGSDSRENDNAAISDYNVQLLRDLELYPEFGKEGASLTRGEFISYVMKLYGVDLPEFSKQIFFDVPSEYEYSRQINAAYSFGLVFGDENKLFMPNDNIAFSDAIAVLVRLLGYAPMLEELGGISGAALRSGLLTDIPETKTGYLNSQTYTLLMKNVLTANMLRSDYNGKFSVNDGQNVLNAFLKLQKVTGQITSCYDTSLYSTGGCGKDEFILTTEKGDMIFQSSLSRAEAFDRLGHFADVYYKEIDGFFYAVSVPVKSKNKELTVYANEINKSFTDKTMLTYYPGNTQYKETAAINRSAYVIYNRSAYNKYTDDDFRISDGNIRLIDTDDNGVYDIVFITSYDYTLVSSVSLGEKRVIDQYFRNSFVFDKDTVFSYQGEEIEPSEIVNTDLLQVETDKNGVVNMVSKITDRVAGTVKSVYDDGCKIDETEYKFSGFYRKISDMKKIPDAFKKAEVGMQQCLLLNEQGEIIIIVDVSGSAGTYSYGYLISLAIEKGVDERINVRMLSENDTVTVFPVKRTLRVDGKTMSDNAVSGYLKANLGAYDTDGILNAGTIVRYCLNDTGEISELDTTCLGDRERNTSLKTFVDNVNAKYSSNAKSLEGYALIGGKTRVFVVPESMKNDNKYYRSYSDATTLLNHQVTYRISAYDIDVAGIPGALLIVLDFDKASGSIGNGSAEYIFDREQSVLGDDGEIRKMLRAYTFDGKHDLLIKDGYNIPQQLKRGDLFRVGWTPDYSEINNFQLVLDIRSQYGTPKKSTKDFTSGDWSWFGQVVQVNGSVVKVRFDGGTEQYFDCSSARGKYLYDEKVDKIEMISVADIHGEEDYGSGDWIMLYSWIGQIKDIFVYRNIGD